MRSLQNSLATKGAPNSPERATDLAANRLIHAGRLRDGNRYGHLPTIPDFLEDVNSADYSDAYMSIKEGGIVLLGLRVRKSLKTCSQNQDSWGAEEWEKYRAQRSAAGQQQIRPRPGDISKEDCEHWKRHTTPIGALLDVANPSPTRSPLKPNKSPPGEARRISHYACGGCHSSVFADDNALHACNGTDFKSVGKLRLTRTLLLIPQDILDLLSLPSWTDLLEDLASFNLVQLPASNFLTSAHHSALGNTQLPDIILPTHNLDYSFGQYQALMLLITHQHMPSPLDSLYPHPADPLKAISASILKALSDQKMGLYIYHCPVCERDFIASGRRSKHNTSQCHRKAAHEPKGFPKHVTSSFVGDIISFQSVPIGIKRRVLVAHYYEGDPFHGAVSGDLMHALMYHLW